MSWKQTTQNSYADYLDVEHKSLSELDASAAVLTL
jgi:hypothetical protein